MGTRGITGVKVDGELKVAQYGQWDHYPAGQGVRALEILRGLNIGKLAASARRCRFATQEDISGKTLDDFPQMDRDHGAEILGIVASAPDGLLLRDDRVCGWAAWSYLVDIDAGTFSCLKGDLNGQLLVTCSLDALPDDDAFIEACSAAYDSGKPISLAPGDVSKAQREADELAANGLRSRGWIVTPPTVLS